jgi:nicotinate-nucleotide pyrophosphorylase (carboxylating)
MAVGSMRTPAPAAGVTRALRLALNEDIGAGDITAQLLIPPAMRCRAEFISRGKCVVAGHFLLDPIFRTLDRNAVVRLMCRDGRSCRKGQRLAVVEGTCRAVLAGERTALNFLQRLSGIATLTRRFVEKAGTHGVAIYDTRKTTPGLREVEKMAVKAGGGRNHRMGLFDGMLVKDNHLAAIRHDPEALRKAVTGARRRCPGRPVEVEAKNESETRLALRAGADVIMLDNMNEGRLRRAMRLIRSFETKNGGRKIAIEISGGVSLKTVGRFARLRPDRISVGALTHSAPAVDISMEVVLV